MSSGEEQPSALRFSQVLRRLVGNGDSRGVIRLVERWLEHGTVTQTARLAQARALMDLRLMDRAWVRLRESAQADPGSAMIQMLTAEMFIERGWPAKARPLLERIEPDGLDDAQQVLLGTLRAAAASAPKGPPSDAAEIERLGTAEQVMELAEMYLASGSLVRAESLLERLLRDGFTPPRVSDLLWAIRGEFVSSAMPTESLLTELAGDEWSVEWGGIELTESLVSDETAHVEIEDFEAQLTAEAKRRGFPRLFRRDEGTGETTAHDEEEVTMSSMSFAGDPEGFESGMTDPDGTPLPGAGDTRIMQVIARGDGVSIEPVRGSIHRARGESVTLDLKRHREAFLPPDDETFLEDEDKDLIVMTRREGRAAAQTPARDRPVQELKRVRPSVPPKAPKREAPPAPVDELQHEPETEDEPVRAGTWVTVGAIVTLAVLAAWMVFAVLHWIAQGQIIQETHQVLARGDFRQIQELEVKLDGQTKAERSPMDVRLVELALVRTILWSDYTGDSGRMVAAQEGLETARKLGAPAAEIALVEGYLALAMGDLQSAHGLLGDLDETDSLHRDLVARIALRVRGDAESRELLARLGAVGPETQFLELLSRESLLTALDDEDDAAVLRERLLSDFPNNPFVQIHRFHEQWDDVSLHDVLALLDDVMESLPGPVSPRQEGRLHAQRAALLTERGELDAAERSWSSALVVDPTHPRYLSHAASLRLVNNQVNAALDDLDRCLGAKPWDRSCRRGMIQVLIELDRLETARQVIDAWGEDGTRVLQAWVHRASGKPEDAIALLEGEGGTLAAWVRGMALMDLGSPKALAALEPVMEGWADVSEPMIRMLVGRARVAQAVTSGDLDQMVQAVEQWGATDPVSHVMVARRLDEAGQQVSAEQMFQQAVDIGPENAMALHALGLFWFDPRASLESARTVWRQYLDLQPSGDRARRTRARMGRR